MIFTFFSCTYDYFEDETNFRLYVPQIEAGTISKFYVAFHDATTGKHVYTRTLEAPFATDDLTKQGILRFKLRAGDYQISCFADYTPNSLTEGNDLSASYNYKFKCDKSNWIQDYGNDIYASRKYVESTSPRTVLTNATVYPIGYAGGKDPVLVDMNEDTHFKGKVGIKFMGLPSEVARVDVIYKGLGTKFCFDGVYDRFASDDCLLMAYENISQYNSGGDITLPTDIINASVGTEMGYTVCPRVTRAPIPEEPLELEVYFYDAAGSTVGTSTFTKAKFDALPAANKPTGDDGLPVSSLVLHPRKTINFVFDGFVVIRIDLVGWGDTSEGELTPM